MSIIGLQKANCKNCYKCVKVCPVKSIKVENEQAKIIDRDCILCGTCLEQCPQNAKTVASDVALVKQMMKSGERVILSIAPSYYGCFDFEDVHQFAGAMKGARLLWRFGDRGGRGVCDGGVPPHHAGEQHEEYHFDLLPVRQPFD